MGVERGLHRSRNSSRDNGPFRGPFPTALPPSLPPSLRRRRLSPTTGRRRGSQVPASWRNPAPARSSPTFIKSRSQCTPSRSVVVHTRKPISYEGRPTLAALRYNGRFLHRIVIGGRTRDRSTPSVCVRADASPSRDPELKVKRNTTETSYRAASRTLHEPIHEGTRRNVFLREERIFFVQRKGCNNVPSLREPLTRRPVRSCPPWFVSKDNAPRETGLSRHGTRHRMTLDQLHARCRRVAAGCTVRYALIEESAGIYARPRVSRMPHARRCELIS